MKALRLMIAEHDVQTRKQIAEYFGSQRGIVIQSTVSNGRDILNQMAAHPPDVLITDLVLPMIDGFAVLEAIAKIPALKDVKIIILTSLTRDSFIERAIALGAHYYMCKPCDFALLYCRVMECVEKSDGKAKEADNIMRNIDSVLDWCGISEGDRGHSYIRTAVMLGTTMTVLHGRITKDLYPEIARLHGTTSQNVERTIRNTIGKHFPKDILSNAPGRPSNGAYIAKLIQLCNAK